MARKRKSPYQKLTAEQKLNVKKNIHKIYNYAHYKIVEGIGQLQRERGITEFQSEDMILNSSRRGRMLDLARNAVRNSSTLNTILKQFDLNGVGTEGGKCIFNFSDLDLAKYYKTVFSNYTRNVDFFDGLNLNTVLKVLLKTMIIGGDSVLLFDDGLIEDSGKLLIFEPDEIGNIPENVLKAKYGKNAKQSQGRVYNGNGRFIGVCVSRSQRGQSEFNPDYTYTLKKDPNSDYFDSLWLMPRNIFRVAQGRGNSQLASVLATILDLEDVTGFEIAASKKNAQCIATITHDKEEAEATAPSVFDNNTDFDALTDEEIKILAQDEIQDEQIISFQKLLNSGVSYESLPAGYNLNMLDLKHPNDRMPEFINWLAGRSSAPLGLSQQYATLAVDGASYKANQLFSQRAFEEIQKMLEQILDWIFYRWQKYALRKGILTRDLSEDDFYNISWAWPRVQELDENAHQDAIQKKLMNLTGSYFEALGPNWREKMMQIKSEIDWLKQNNLPIIAYNMISGGEKTGADKGVSDEEFNNLIK